ncbi:MAG: diguanylate cyclase, partial [Desulfovibrionaceae bacterium]
NDLWWPGSMEVTVFPRGKPALERILLDPPDLLILEQRLPDTTGKQILELIKGENVYRQVPVILCLDEGDMEYPWDWTDVEADDFLLRPYSPVEVRDRVNLTLCRALRSLDANPLTRLPGNTTIIQRLQGLIDRKADFGLGYCDLDYFKSFNDKYGFSRGDEVLMMAARVVVNTVKRYKPLGEVRPFVGHVGGDDFVFMVHASQAEDCCRQIIKSFDDIVPSFYDADDRRRGYIHSVDRQGREQNFPLMAVSIAVVFNTNGKLTHYGEASSVAVGLKKKAKENPKSSYVLDQRAA